MIYDPRLSNPLAGNPLRTRADVAAAAIATFEPLLRYFSDGGARVRLDASGASFDRAAADLEGFARPLWGIVPLVVGGGHFPHWELYRRGLANGTDPAHPEYWGACADLDQKLVELAAIGFALRSVPEHLWDPLSEREKANAAAYLIAARARECNRNNWRFFRVLIDLGLEQMGVAFDAAPTERYLDEIDGYYLGDGWYRDGDVRRVDHYVPMALHFYGLIYTVLGKNAERQKRFAERAAQFAPAIINWYDGDGGALAFGRSMTYRFACGAIWGALAFAGVEALPWGTIKGLYLRHLRWWSDRPIAARDGVLTVGYGYPNLLMSESYNSAGSPYWAMKMFLPLSLPTDHPFWQAGETPLDLARQPVAMLHPGMVTMATQRNVVALSSGQQNLQMRFGAEKNAKFAYSSRYGFSVESDDRKYAEVIADSMIAFSDDGRHYRVREDNEEAMICDDVLYARWRPFADVKVETYLIPAGLWYVRIHRIETPRPLQATEGGFAIPRADFDIDRREVVNGAARVVGQADISVIADLGTTKRTGRVLAAAPNTNLISAKTWVPQLTGSIVAGITILITAAMAAPSGEGRDAGSTIAFPEAPEVPDLEAIESAMRLRGARVTAMFSPNR